MTQSKPKIIVILGPTAVGKSSLAVLLAHEFGGEIVSADSRQVYRGFDIGTGKVTEKEMEGVPHHLLDVVDINDDFSVADFKKRAHAAITRIHKKGKLPIVVGGTGLYIKALVDDMTPPAIPPDKELRTKLETKSPKELFEKLSALDKERARSIDKHNPRRLIRAIEIATHLGTVPPLETGFPKNYDESRYEVLQIGLDERNDDLRKRIEKRTEERLDNGWTGEVWKHIQDGVSWARIEEFGLGYRCIIEFLEKKIGIADLPDCISTSEWQYAKRQRTWFDRDKRIKWFTPSETKKIKQLVTQFLKD